MRLGDILDVKGGKRIPAGLKLLREDTGFKYIRVADMKDGSIMDSDIHYISEEIYQKISNYTISSNDLYITCAGTIGKVGLVPEIFDGANLTENANKLIFSYLNKKWLFYFLSSNFVQEQIKEATTKVGQPKLAIKRILEVRIPLIPLNEQHRIVAKIEELLPFIDQYDQKEQALTALNKNFPEQLKKSILQAAIQGKLTEQLDTDEPAIELVKRIQTEKLRLISEKKLKKTKGQMNIFDPDNLQNENVPFEIPENWVWVRLGAIILLNPRNKLDDDLDVSFIPMNLISDGYKNEHSFQKKKWKEIKSGFTHFSENDLAIAKITPCFENRKSVIFQKLKNGFGAGTTELFILRAIKETINIRYLFWFVKSHYFINNGVKSYTGTAGQQRISSNYINNCLFPLPPLSEQHRIVEKIELLLNQINHLS